MIIHKLYTEENLKKKSLPINEFKKYLNKDDQKIFFKNIEKWGLKRSNNEFDHIGYSKEYCMVDCVVLMKGYNTFKKWVKEICKGMGIPKMI